MIKKSKQTSIIAPNKSEKSIIVSSESVRKQRELQKQNDKELDNVYVIKPKGTFGPPIRIRTNSITNVKKSAAKITRLMAYGEIPLEYGRSLVYALQQLSGLYKIEYDLEVLNIIEGLKRDVKMINASRVNDE